MIKRETFLYCDAPTGGGLSCCESHNEILADGTLKEHRRIAKEDGWKVVKRMDICPRCYKKYKEKTLILC